MGLLSNQVDRSQLQPGDHIYSYRKLHTYSHHGIYVEADRVIHYNRTNVAKRLLILGRHCGNCGHHPELARGVVKTCVDCFLAGHELYRFEYDVSYGHFVIQRSGTCTTGRSVSADESILQAVKLLNNKGGFGDYKLFENNCESFAIYCKTNRHMSQQAFSVISFGKCAVKAFMKYNLDRLLHDVSVHHPNKYMELKQTIETHITLPCKEIIATLKKFNAKDEDDQELYEDDKVDEHLETMEKEYHGASSQLSNPYI